MLLLFVSYSVFFQIKYDEDDDHCIRSLSYYGNNRLFCKLLMIMGRAAARSDEKISRQLPQASARLRQRKGGQFSRLTL